MEECSDYYAGMPVPTKVQDFQSCVSKVGLMDIPFVGPVFTWSNKRTDGFLAKKLDRVMGNSQWLDNFHDYEAQFLAPEFSDHCAGLIVPHIPLVQKHRPF